mgnify:CR=1 FL=1
MVHGYFQEINDCINNCGEFIDDINKHVIDYRISRSIDINKKIVKPHSNLDKNHGLLLSPNCTIAYMNYFIEYNGGENIDFTLSFPNMSLVGNTVRISGKLNVKKGNDYVGFTDKIFYDGMTGIHSFFNNIVFIENFLVWFKSSVKLFIPFFSCITMCIKTKRLSNNYKFFITIRIEIDQFFCYQF